MGIAREGSTAIRKISFIFGLACLVACSTADQPSIEDGQASDCMLDSECAAGERCDASECVPADDLPDSGQVSETDLVELLEESTITDIAVILGNRDGIQFTHSKGDLNTSSIVPIASASKWLSAMILMRLVEEGVLSLSDNPQDYLSFWTESSDDARSRITLAHLLSFTSGFEGSTGLGAQEGVACIEDAETTIEACAEAIFASGLKEDGGISPMNPEQPFITGRFTSISRQRWRFRRRDCAGTSSFGNTLVQGLGLLCRRALDFRALRMRERQVELQPPLPITRRFFILI